MTENLSSKSGVANETARMQAIKMRWYEYDLADRIDKQIIRSQQKRDGKLNREGETYKTEFLDKLIQGIASANPNRWDDSWFVFCVAGRPAGEKGLPILMSGKEVLLSEKPTTENPAGSYRARTGLARLKQDGKSGRLVRRNDATFDKAVIKVRNEACMKDEDPDEAEAVFIQDVLGSKPGGKKGGGIDTSSKRLDVHASSQTEVRNATVEEDF